MCNALKQLDSEMINIRYVGGEVAPSLTLTLSPF